MHEPITNMSRVERGTLAEQLVLYQFRRRGIDVYVPLHAMQYVDCIVVRSGKVIKCQIKSTCAVDLVVGLRHTVYADGKYSRQRYARGNVDVFILVDLLNENIFIVPAEILDGKHNVSLKPTSIVWQFLNRFDLL